MTETFLIGERLRLRALEPEDLDVMYALENDTTTWDISNLNVPYSRYVLREYIKSTQYDLFADKQLRLMMERKADGEVVGAIDISDFEPLHARGEVGIVVKRGFRGQGYGAEALELLCHYAFRFLGMHQLTAHVAVDNTVCLRLFKEEGFVECGCLRQWWRVEGVFKDVVVLQRFGRG